MLQHVYFVKFGKSKATEGLRVQQEWNLFLSKSLLCFSAWNNSCGYFYIEARIQNIFPAQLVIRKFDSRQK